MLFRIIRIWTLRIMQVRLDFCSALNWLIGFDFVEVFSLLYFQIRMNDVQLDATIAPIA